MCHPDYTARLNSLVFTLREFPGESQEVNKRKRHVLKVLLRQSVLLWSIVHTLIFRGIFFFPPCLNGINNPGGAAVRLLTSPFPPKSSLKDSGRVEQDSVCLSTKRLWGILMWFNFTARERDSRDLCVDTKQHRHITNEKSFMFYSSNYINDDAVDSAFAALSLF